jgi:hypothetical protein
MCRDKERWWPWLRTRKLALNLSDQHEILLVYEYSAVLWENYFRELNVYSRERSSIFKVVPQLHVSWLIWLSISVSVVKAIAISASDLDFVTETKYKQGGVNIGKNYCTCHYRSLSPLRARNWRNTQCFFCLSSRNRTADELVSNQTFVKHSVMETGLYLRLMVVYTACGPIDSWSLSPDLSVDRN